MGSCSASASNSPHKNMTHSSIKMGIHREGSLYHQGKSVSRQAQKTKLKIDNRLKSIDISDAPSALIENREKLPKDIKLIELSLSKHFLFNNLTDVQKALLINQMKYYSIEPNSIIFEQEQCGNNFYIIASGKVEVIIDNIRNSVLKPGDSFGELALLHDALRSGTVRTLEKTCLWSVDRSTFRQVVHSINSQNYKENKKFIENVTIFKTLSEEQQEILLGSMVVQTYTPGTKIVNDGDPGNLLYIIKEGKVVVVKNGEEIRQMEKGDYFGEQALLYETNRTASIFSLTNVTCLSISGSELNKALGTQLQQIIYKNCLKMAIEKDPMLKQLTNLQISKISEKINIQTFEKNEIVVYDGSDISQNLIIIVKGSLTWREKTFELFSCVFSDEFCNKKQTMLLDHLIAEDHCDLGIIDIKDFEAEINGSFPEISIRNKIISVLRQIPIINNMSLIDLERIVKSMQPHFYNDGFIILEENANNDSLYIILSGEVNLYKSESLINTLSNFGFFGDRSLIFKSSSLYTAKCSGAVEVLTLTHSSLLSLFNETIKSQLLKRIHLEDDTILLSDLVLVKKIGTGMFGNVFLMHHRGKRINYAIKSVCRKKIEAFNIQSSIVLERRVMKLLNHPFIMKLVKTFKDSNRVYFLLEHIVGMDLFDVLRKLNLLNESDSKFYTACLLLTLEHLHNRDVIYRDLKPENVVIDLEGFVKLIDFGVSKIIKGRTFTLVGTPHYMPPEIIEGRGYNVNADYWNLGVMLYEFLCGNVPFGEDQDEPFAIYEKVLNHKIVYPQWVEISEACKNIIERLLNKNPNLRLAGSVANLKSHSWFSGMNWERLVNKQLKPPFIPPVVDLWPDINKAIQLGAKYDQLISDEEQKDVYKEVPNKKSFDSNWDEEF